MSEHKNVAVKKVLDALVRAPLLRAGWVVDDRFEHVVMRVLSKDDIKAVWADFESIFSKGVEEESLLGASKDVRHLASVMGGLRNDQFLFIREEDDGLLAFAAIWPWQNAPQVSVRLGFSGVEELDPSLFEGLLVPRD